MNRVAAVALLATGVLAPGFAIVALVAGGRALPAAFVLGSSVALGAGALGYGMFLLSLAGHLPSATAIAGLVVVSAGILAACAATSRLPRIVWPAARVRVHEWALLALLALPLAWLVADALRVPFHNIDAIAIWSLKGKVLARETVLATTYFHDPARSYSHQDYPLLVPFLTATAYGLRGSFDEAVAKLAQAALTGALVGLLYAGFRRSASRAGSLVLLLLFLGSPALLSQASGGLADPALMLYYAGSLVALLTWLDTRDSAYLALGALLTAFLLFTKNEGMALAALHLALFSLACVRAGGWRSFRLLAIHAALALALMGPWLWFRSATPRTHENYGALLRPARVAEQIDRVPEIVAFLGRTAVDPWLWGGLWLLLPVAALLAWGQRTRHAGLAWACLAGHLAVYVVVLVVTPWELRALLEAKAYPLLLQASPALLLLLSIYWGALLPPPAGVPGRGTDREGLAR